MRRVGRGLRAADATACIDAGAARQMQQTLRFVRMEFFGRQVFHVYNVLALFFGHAHDPLRRLQRDA